jgi:hypothetical protein
MALQKQNININFSQGLDTKTDSWQVQPGKFLALQNSIFTKGGLLQKRNGYQQLPAVSNLPSFISTFAGNLITTGTSLQVLSEDTDTWSNRGNIQPVDLNVLVGARTAINMVTSDAAIASNNLAVVAYMDSANNSFYQVLDSQTGQIIVSQTQLPNGMYPRTFAIGNYLVVTFLALVSSSPHLQYVAIPTGNPSNPKPVTDISTSVKSNTTGYDGATYAGNLFLSWNGSDAGGAIRSTFLDAQLNQHNTIITTGHTADLVSVAIDTFGSNAVMWTTIWDSSDSNGWTMSFYVSSQLAPALAPTQVITDIPISQITSYVSNGLNTIFYATINYYPAPLNTTRTDFISSVTCNSSAVVTSPSVILRGVGIVGKAFYLSSTNTIYLLASYAGAFQPTNFLIDSKGNVIAKLAYENSGGYLNNGQIASISNVSGTTVTYAYLYKFLAVPVNSSQGISAPGAVYGQAGINLASFSINMSGSVSQEIAGCLHITGGFLWLYDGAKPVEFDFHVYPEDVGVSGYTASGSLSPQQYYYYYVYAWTDAQGMVHRSAPSIPYGVNLSGNTSISMNIPTYRQTYKTSPNQVRIEIYRWSQAQQIPYLITSQTNPILNNTSVDYIYYIDTASDASILGNEILYTEGGIVEDIAPPACSVSTLYRSRMFLVDAEDRNLLWFSKQTIESVPVEFSDLLTIYIAPTFGAQGNGTGPITALAAMDGNLIIFKKDAIYYITGDGPDNTGANSDYGDPVYIAGTVGCTNPESIVLMPDGLMFQSDKGIWLLSRALQTTYVGAPVEQYNSNTVLASVVVPGTNQVRFTMSNNITLMYDYFYQAWGTFVNVPAVSSTIYQGLHTFLNSYGQVYQENPGSYVDGASPVLLSFTTSWFNLAGLQGYERAYFFFLIGQYMSPHKLQVQIAYDYNPYPAQQVLIQPDNYNAPYGDDTPYGNQSPYGGPSAIEQWRVFFNRQTCEAFQITINEIYDSSFGVPAGAGLTLSGLNLIFGTKNRYPRLPATRQAG